MVLNYFLRDVQRLTVLLDMPCTSVVLRARLDAAITCNALAWLSPLLPLATQNMSWELFGLNVVRLALIDGPIAPLHWLLLAKDGTYNATGPLELLLCPIVTTSLDASFAPDNMTVLTRCLALLADTSSVQQLLLN